MKITRPTLLLTLLSMAAACGGSSPDASEPATPAAPTTEADTKAPATELEPMLGLAEMSVHFEGREGLRIHADGSVEADMGGWQPLGSISTDGNWTHDGKVVASLGADGKVTFSGSGDSAVQLVGETLSFKGQTLSINDEGWVTGGRPETEGKLQVKGITDAASKRTALLVIISMMASGRAESEAATSSPPMTK